MKTLKATFAVFIFFYQYLCAQHTNTVNTQDSLSAKLQAELFKNSSNTPENFHVNTDRNWYFAGDEAWFKIYLTTNGLHETGSGILYVNLADSAGHILLKRKLLINDLAVSYGMIPLPRNLKSGWYSLGVQTEWNRNFNNGFEKLIYVNRRRDLPPVISATRSVSEQDRVRFFPEGGNFVAGLQSRFAVSTVNENGEPEPVQLFIIDTLINDTLAAFSTSLHGLGQFTLPANHSQTIIAFASWPKRNISRHSLPGMVSKGITLQASLISEKLYYKIESTPGFLPADEEIMLTATMHNEIVFSKLFKQEKELISLSNFIPLNYLPSGIISLRLYTRAGKLVAIRNVYHHKERQPAIEKKLIGFEHRAKNEITISLPDTLYGTYSVSITDADLQNEEAFELKNEEKNIQQEDPFSLFKAYRNLGSEIDLYLLTLNSNFKQIAASDPMASLKFKPEIGLNITGKVYYERSGKQISGTTIIFFPKNKTTGNFLLTDTLDSKGNFELENLFLTDSAIVYWKVNGPDKKDINKLSLALKETWFDSLRSRPTILREKHLNKIENTKVAGVQATLNKYYETDSLYNVKSKTLTEVTVVSKMKDRIQELEEKYVGASLFAGKLSFAYTFDVEEEKGFYTSIFSYMQGRVPSLKILGPPTNPLLLYRSPISLSGTLTNVAVFLNDTRVEASDVSSIPVSEIAYLKVFRPPFSYQLVIEQGPPASSNRLPPPISLVIAIYLRKDARKQEPVNDPFVLRSFAVKGFSLSPPFPATDHSAKSASETIPDKRVTFFWNPELAFTNGKANILFYNNDFTKRYRVNIEGINELGEVISFSEVIER